ncbi:MAG: NAD(P)H-quinone oxidoreductase, partial [Propionibacteriaceae bacterium]|nr:NAD(P)H-quinone oxidoreductase [Propionibacteriaceae bacterium]
MLAIVAVAAGDPEVLRVEEVETPRPGPEEVLIKVAAAGVNRADLMQRQGHYPPPPGASPIIGLECSGEIAELGSDVTGWEVGDACVALLAGGGYAEYVAVPAGQVIEPPGGIDRVTAAGLVEVAATVTSNMAIAALGEGDIVLVHGGAGGVGSFAIQYAKALKATVVATAGSEEKLAYCRSIGADLAVSYRQDWVGGVRDFCADRGVDVILDNMGAKYLTAHVSLLGVGGRLMVIGLQGGRKGELD